MWIIAPALKNGVTPMVLWLQCGSPTCQDVWSCPRVWLCWAVYSHTSIQDIITSCSALRAGQATALWTNTSSHHTAAIVVHVCVWAWQTHREGGRARARESESNRESVRVRVSEGVCVSEVGLDWYGFTDTDIFTVNLHEVLFYANIQHI